MTYGMQLAAMASAKLTVMVYFYSSFVQNFILLCPIRSSIKSASNGHMDTHPRSKHGHMIDFILRSTCNVRVLQSADCDIDHNLVRGKFKLCIRRKICMAGVRVSKRIDVSKLKDPAIRIALNEKLSTVEFDDTRGNF